MTPFDYCRSKAAPEGSSLYYCLLFVPRDRYDALLALMALERELDELVEQTSDAAIAISKLEFWRRELQTLDTTARHPVSRALVQSGAAALLNARDRHQLIDTAARRVGTAQVQSLPELAALCEGSVGCTMAIASRLYVADRETEATARRLGSACEATRYVFARRRAGLPPHTTVPLSLLREHQASPGEVDRDERSAPVRALRATLATWAGDALASALARPAPRFAHARARLARAELEARLAGRRGITPVGKLWIAWRTTAG